MNSGLAPCGDRQLWYATRGETGPRVLLVMGFGFPGDAWKPQIEGLSQDHQLAWYDNRGVGRSDTAPGRYGMRELADDAAALLDHLGWADAHIVGVSMGGMVAQEIALRHRDRTRSLALIATQPGGRRGWIPTRRGMRLFLTANLSRGDRRRNALRKILFPGLDDMTSIVDDMSELEKAIDEPIPLSTAVRQLEAVIRHDTRRRLGTLGDLDTLIVRPARDILVPPQQSDRLHALIPGSRLISFAEAGHGVHVQCADELNPLLRAHFQRAEERRASA